MNTSRCMQKSRHTCTPCLRTYTKNIRRCNSRESSTNRARVPTLTGSRPHLNSTGTLSSESCAADSAGLSSTRVDICIHVSHSPACSDAELKDSISKHEHVVQRTRESTAPCPIGTEDGVLLLEHALTRATIKPLLAREHVRCELHARTTKLAPSREADQDVFYLLAGFVVGIRIA